MAVLSRERVRQRFMAVAVAHGWTRRVEKEEEGEEEEGEAPRSPPPAPPLSSLLPFLLLCLPKTLLSTAAAPKTTQLLLAHRHSGSTRPLHSSATTNVSCAGSTLNRSHGTG